MFEKTEKIFYLLYHPEREFLVENPLSIWFSNAEDLKHTPHPLNGWKNNLSLEELSEESLPVMSEFQSKGYAYVKVKVSYEIDIPK